MIVILNIQKYNMNLSKTLKRVLASALIITMNSWMFPFSTLGTAYASAPWNISSNLSFWLKTDSWIDLNSWFTWADSSTNWRDVANSTPATTPVLSANDINFNTWVLFDGDNDYLMSLGNPLWTTDPNFTMFVIWRPQKTFEPVAFLWHGDTNAADGWLYFQMIDTQFSVKEEWSAFYMGPSTIDRPSIVKISKDPNVVQKWKFWVNWKETFSSTNGSVIDTAPGSPIVIGNRSTLWGSTSYQGTLNEIIVYSGALTDNESHRITSYLACKYGMTLDQSTPTDYILSNDTVIWNATTAWTKNKNIWCVAKDVDTSLNQMKSKTINSTSDITVEVVDKMAVSDKAALTWWHDDGNLIFQSSGIRSGYWRVGREYATMGTDTIWDVKVSIPKASLPSTWQNAKYYLFKIPSSANGDFTSNDMIPVLWSVNGADVEFLTNFTSGDHFTLWRDEVSWPGWVSGVDFTLWLKGNVWYSTGSTDTWYDQSPYGNDFTQNNSSLKPVSWFDINGNNAFSFDWVRLFEKTNTKSNAFMNIPGWTTSTWEWSIFLVYIPESIGMTSIFKQYNSYTPFSLNASTTNAWFSIRNWSANSTIPYASPSSTIPRISSSIITWSSVKSYVSWGNEAVSSIWNELIMLDWNAADIGWAFNGKIAELITYKSPVSADAKSSIESYLACKYGLTLEQWVSGQNYYLSDRSVMWDATENTWFRNSVGCIARDESSSFYQTGSKNTESSKWVISVSATSLNDKESLTWSDDWLSYSDWTFKMSPIWYKKLLKSWRFSEKGWDVWSVNISIPKNDLPQHNWSIVLLKDTDTDFSSWATIITWVENGSNLEFNTNVLDEEFITFAYEPTKGLAFWIKADSNLFNATNNVTWTEVSVDEWKDAWNSISFKQTDGSANPQIKLNSINGNPTVSFDGVNDSLSATWLILENSLQKEIFIVNNNWTSSNWPIFFQGDNTTNYSPYFWANGKFTQMNYVWGQDTFTWFSDDIAPNIYSVRYEYSQTWPSNAYIIKNGWSEASLPITDEPFQTASITKSTIGWRLQSTSEFFNGDVAEVIAYSTGLTNIERSKVLSYLYIKYGINPNQSVPQSIINSNWDNVWNSTELTYNHDIASIGRDDYFSLNQKSSRSSSFSGELKISVSNIDADKKSLSWANDYWDYLWQNTEAPIWYKRMSREWKFQELNWDIWDVSISMYNDILPSGFGWDLLLYVDDDGNFGNGVKATYTWSLSWNEWTFPAFNVDNGDYATIWYYSNVPPTDVKIGTWYTSSLNENNLIGSKIEDINGYDPNDDPLVYSLSCTVPWTDDANFSITGSGLYAETSFNFESPIDSNADNSYDVCIRATDIIWSKYDKHVTINVLWVNEAPSMIMLSWDQVLENLWNNVLIGSIIPSDVDSSIFTYEFVSWTWSEDNALFSIVNDNELRINNTTDYETKTSYNVRLKVSDDNLLFIERDFVINVIDVDDFKPTINITDDIDVWPVISDDFSFSVGDTWGSNLLSVAKSYSPDAICNSSDSFDLLSFSGSNPSFTINQANETKNWTYICIRAEDNAWNFEYAIASNQYNLDNTPPVDPIVLTPEQPTWLINTRTPTITGTWETWTIVKAYVWATEVCSATIMTGGTFSCWPFSPALSEWTNALTIKACDSSFPTPNCSAEVNFSILSDTEAPTIMDIISHKNGGKYQGITTVTWTWEKFMTARLEIYDSTWSTVWTWTWSIDNATYFSINAWLSNIDEWNYSMSWYIIDTIGNISPVQELSFSIDKTNPTWITFLTPENGNLSNNIHPTITGTGEAFWKAYVKFWGTTYSSDITSTWSWSIYINDSLSDWANSIEWYQEDEALNRSVSSFLTLNVDTTPPSNPTISTPTDWKHISDKHPTISGSGAANEMYWLELNGKTYTGVISPVGSWSVPIVEDLPDMNFTATVKSLDTLWNETPFVPSNFTVDTIAPLVSSIISPLTWISTTDVRPTIIANWENDVPSFIEFRTSTWYVVMTLSWTSTVDGDFVLTPPTDLPDNNYNVVAYQIDLAWNESPQTSISITIDTTAPEKPTITSPLFSQVINTKNPTITGSWEVWATIRILIDWSDTMTGVVAPDGSWILNTSFNLSEWNHTVLANLIDAELNVWPNESSSFSVDTTSPLSVTITSPTQPNWLINTTSPVILWNTELSSNVTIKSSTWVNIASCIANVDGDYSCGPISIAFNQGINEFSVESCDHATPTPNCISSSWSVNVDSINPTQPTVSFPVELEMINDSTPTISGSGEANASVFIKIWSNTYPGIVDGSWSFSVNYPDTLIDGDYSVDVWLKDSAQNQSSVKTVNFSVDTWAPVAPIILSPSNGNVSSDTTPTITGKSENNAIITINTNGKSYTGTSNGIGDWTINITDALSPDGTFNIIANQTDKAWNTSPDASISITVDTTPPESITISTPTWLISDNTPIVSWTWEIGGGITISIGGNNYNTSVLWDGTWSLTVSNALSDWLNTWTWYIIDQAWNRSIVDSTFSFSIDSTPPNAPIISTPTHNEFVKTNMPTFTWSGEVGSLVTLTITPNAYTWTVDASGSFSIETTNSLSDSNYSASINLSDSLWNVSSSSVRTFYIDTTSPIAPTVSTPTNNQIFNTWSFSVSWNGEIPSTINVYIDSVLSYTWVSDWAWHFDIPMSWILDGIKTIEVEQFDIAGNNSPKTTLSVLIDSINPWTPTILSPENFLRTKNNRITLTATGEINSNANLKIRNTAMSIVQSIDVVMSWTWYVEIMSDALSDDDYVLILTLSDIAWNISSPALINAHVDTTPPSKPNILTLSQWYVSSDNTPLLSGTGEVNSLYELLIDSIDTYTWSLSWTGYFEFNTNTLIDWPHTIKARLTDDVWNIWAYSDDITFNIDTTPPVLANISFPLDNVGLTKLSNPVFYGSWEALSEISVIDSSGATLCSTSVDWSGSFICWPSIRTFTDWLYTLDIQSCDHAMITPNCSNATWSVTIDLTPPNDIIVVEPLNASYTSNASKLITWTAEPNSLVSITVWWNSYTWSSDENGDWSITPSALSEWVHTITGHATDLAWNIWNDTFSSFTVDTIPPDMPWVGIPSDWAYINNNKPYLSGTGEANMEYDITIDWYNYTWAVLPDGTWSLSVPDTLTDWTKTVYVMIRDLAKNESPEKIITINLDSSNPSAILIINPTDDKYVWDNTPTLSWLGEAWATVSIDIDSNTYTWIVDMNGSWTLNVSNILIDWTYPITGFQTDLALNVSPLNNISIHIDTTSPIAPTITSPVDSTVSSNTIPVISFTGEPYATFDIYDGSTHLWFITSGVSWSDSFILTWSLSEGSHLLKVSQKDRAWNVSIFDTITYIVDTTAPNSPNFIDPSEWLSYSDSWMTVYLSWENNASAYIELNGTPLAWPFTLSNTGSLYFSWLTFIEWFNTLYATITDGAWNVSTGSLRTFNYDSTAPTPPTILTPINWSLTNTWIITFSWSWDTDSSISILNSSGSSLCTTTAMTGSYSCVASTWFIEWNNNFTVMSCDTAIPTPNCSSNTWSVAIDTIKPTMPSILSHIEGGVYSLNDVLLSWTWESNTNIEMALSGSSYTWTISSTWAYSFQSDYLSEGSYTFNIRSIDTAWNIGDANHLWFTIDRTPPTPLSILSPIQPNWYQKTLFVYFSGTWEVNSDILVKNLSWSTVCSTTINWSWSFECTAWTWTLSEWLNVITINNCDNATPVKNCSDTWINTYIDSIVPSAVSITSPTNWSVVESSPITITSNGEANASVIFDINSHSYTGTFNSSGSLSISFTPWAVWSYYIKSKQTDLVGNESVESTSSFIYSPVSTSTSWGGGGYVSMWSVSGWYIPSFCNLYVSKTSSSSTDITYLMTWKTYYATTAVMNNNIWSVSIWNQQKEIKIPYWTVSKYTLSVDWLWGKWTCSVDVWESKPVITSTGSNTIVNTNTTKPNTVLKELPNISGSPFNVCKWYVKVVDDKDLVFSDLWWESEFVRNLASYRSLSSYEILTRKISPSTPSSGIINNSIAFNGDRNLTRAEFLKMVVNAVWCKYKPTTKIPSYKDVDKSDWFYQYVSFAQAEWWIWQSENFRPNDNITRGEVSKILIKSTWVKIVMNTTKNIFDDIPASMEFAPYVWIMKKNLIVSWQLVWNKILYRPNDNISRSEIAKILSNTFVKGNKFSTTK